MLVISSSAATYAIPSKNIKPGNDRQDYRCMLVKGRQLHTLALADSPVILCRVEHENVKERSFSFSGLTHEQLMIGKSSYYRN